MNEFIREDVFMYKKEELCQKIIKLYPDIGQCGIDVAAKFDRKKNVWIIDLKKDEHELKHHLEISDADDCMDGR